MERNISEEFAALREEIRAYSDRRANARAPAGGGPLEQQTQQSQRPTGGDEWLLGWKAIARYFGLSEDTVQRYARRITNPLPVRKIGGHAALQRSVADAWRTSQPFIGDSNRNRQHGG
jgi:hypothetical protein